MTCAPNNGADLHEARRAPMMGIPRGLCPAGTTCIHPPLSAGGAFLSELSATLAERGSAFFLLAPGASRARGFSQRMGAPRSTGEWAGGRFFSLKER